MSLVQSYNKASIFLGLIEYELNSLLGASHLVDYISVHIRFDLERYLLIISYQMKPVLGGRKFDEKFCSEGPGFDWSLKICPGVVGGWGK